MGFLSLNVVQTTLSEGQIVCHDFDFRGDLSIYRAENRYKRVSFNAEINGLIIPKQLPNNFGKVQRTVFLTLKMVKKDPL